MIRRNLYKNWENTQRIIVIMDLSVITICLASHNFV